MVWRSSRAALAESSIPKPSPAPKTPIPPIRLPIVARTLARVHVWLYRVSAGLIGHRLGHLSCLVLTTTGAKTGKARSAVLVYSVHGNDLVLVASQGGLPRHPAWYVNLVARPLVDVQLKRRRIRMHARTASAAERPELWRLMVAEFAGYDEYQRRTTREIPVVVLEPAV
jgi:deazaflavin-dependent oxidoreductase (nitroreductase family)